MKPIPTLTFAAALLAATAGAAHADCKSVIEAYGKADATKRFALYEVSTIAKEPKGDPYMIFIGDVQYVPNVVRKGPLQFETVGYKSGPYSGGSEAASLKVREKKGVVLCEPLGERKIGTEQALGYQIRDAGTKSDPAAIHMWVSRSTGLPMAHGMGSDEDMLRWVYGSAVVAPAPDKVHK
jgi:hypothetical protein